MKHILLLFLAILSFSSYAQISKMGGMASRVNDSSAYVTNATVIQAHADGYHDIWLSNASNLFWKWNGSAYEILDPVRGVTGNGVVNLANRVKGIYLYTWEQIVGGGTINLNFSGHVQALFHVSSALSEPRNVELLNDNEAHEFSMFVNVTDISGTLDFGSGSVFQSNDPRFDVGSQVLTFTATGNYIIHAYFNETNWWLELVDGTGSPGGGHTIEDEGTPLTQRTKLNFVGAGVTVTDDSGDDATVVTISGGTIDGSGTTNELPYWVDSNTLGALAVSTYPSLTEFSYGKGVTSAIQTQLNTKLSSSNFQDKVTPTGAVNGVNVTYTLPATPIAGSEHVYLNGILQESGAGNDYTISGATITYLTAPSTGDKIRVSFRQ